MTEKIKVGSDFSGVGAFNQALKRLNIDFDEIFACDMDKYARDTFILNYGEPTYFPENVYDREIPKESLDIYMTSPPCQPFSMSGGRKGEADKRGVLFYNSHDFIKINKPRYFIFENVKGLTSHDKGRTFKNWIDMLSGKTINGNDVIFPHSEALPYHVYHKVLNAKKFGIPQNRERIFIIGIRDDSDNDFKFPKPFHLTKKLRDCLETEFDEKYYLSEATLRFMFNHSSKQKSRGNGFNFTPTEGEGIANCITARCFKMGIDDNYIKIPTNTAKGFEVATENDSINYSNSNSKTRRGRVGHGVAQTLDSACNQGVIVFEPRHQDSKTAENFRIRKLLPRECFRLMDFPEDFIWQVSDTQAYKQAGNSIPVGLLVLLIQKFNLKK